MSINWTNFLSESNKIKLESGDLNSDSTYVGIEIVHMIKKNQMISQGETMFDSFTSLAA